MPVSRPLDVSRMLPPSMRGALGGSGFAWKRVALWLVLVGGFCAYEQRTQATQAPDDFEPEVTYQGRDASFSYGRTADGDALWVDGTVRPVTATATASFVSDASGPWTVQFNDKAQLVATHPSHGSFTIRGHGPNEWLVLDANKERLYKVKVVEAEHKLGVYDATGKRVVRGKLKNARIVVRDDGDHELGSLDGSTDLGVAAWLVTPIPVEVRLLVAKRYQMIAPGDEAPDDDKPDTD